VSWVHVAGKMVQKRCVMDRAVIYAFTGNGASEWRQVLTSAVILCVERQVVLQYSVQTRIAELHSDIAVLT